MLQATKHVMMRCRVGQKLRGGREPRFVDHQPHSKFPGAHPPRADRRAHEGEGGAAAGPTLAKGAV